MGKVPGLRILAHVLLIIRGGLLVLTVVYFLVVLSSTAVFFDAGGWLYFRIKFLFRPRPGEQHKDHQFYRTLYPQILRDIQVCLSCSFIYNHCTEWCRKTWNMYTYVNISICSVMVYLCTSRGVFYFS